MLFIRKGDNLLFLHLLRLLILKVSTNGLKGSRASLLEVHPISLIPPTRATLRRQTNETVIRIEGPTDGTRASPDVLSQIGNLLVKRVVNGDGRSGDLVDAPHVRHKDGT